MLSTPCSRVDGRAMKLVMAPRPANGSSAASSRTLMAQLPSRLATARPGLPEPAATPTVATSGRDVMPASSSIPAKAWPMPVRTASTSTTRVRRAPAVHTAAAATAKMATSAQTEVSASIGGCMRGQSAGRSAVPTGLRP